MVAVPNIILYDLVVEAWANAKANDSTDALVEMGLEQAIFDICGKDADIERFVEQHGEELTINLLRAELVELDPRFRRG